MVLDLDNIITKNFPFTPGCPSEHVHDSSGNKSPRSIVETLSWEVPSIPSSSAPDSFCAEVISIETMSNRRSSCSAVGPARKNQRIFPPRVSMARKQARQYFSDNDSIFSIVEEEKPSTTIQRRMPRSQFQSKITAVPGPNSLLGSLHSLSSSPPVSSTVSPQEVPRSRFDAAASVFRSGRQSQPQMRQARFGSHREHLQSQKLVSERKKIFDSNHGTVKQPKRLDSIPPPAPIEPKTEPGTPSTEGSVDEWSFASWIETPTPDFKKTLFP